MVNYKLKTILVMAERTKFILQGTKDLTIRLPIEYLHSMGWKIGDEVLYNQRIGIKINYVML